jgi:hypothetical protein
MIEDFRSRLWYWFLLPVLFALVWFVCIFYLMCARW